MKHHVGYVCFNIFGLIRRNFRADKFSRIFAQKLNLCEIARKLVRNLRSFLQVRENLFVRKFLKKIFKEKMIIMKCYYIVEFINIFCTQISFFKRTLYLNRDILKRRLV